MLSGRSQTQIVRYCMIVLYEISKIGKSTEPEFSHSCEGLGKWSARIWGTWGFPGDSVKNPPAMRIDLGSVLGLGRSPGGRAWQPTPVFLHGESHGQRSLVGYSPWGRKELDMTD